MSSEVVMMNTILTALFLALSVNAAIGQGNATGVLQSGEELQYKVKWNFLRLGTITLKTVRDTSSADSVFYRLTNVVKSNPTLVFVRLRETNESLVSANDLHTRRYRGTHCSSSETWEISYAYDAVHRLAFCREKELRSGHIEYDDTLQNVPPFVEGASLLVYARCKSHSGKAYGIPTMVGGQLHKTRLDFSLTTEDIDVDGIDYTVRSQKFAGSADWRGGSSAGLGGDFTGWVSDDAAAVPLRAEMKILLGSITIELEKWTRPGWVPPSTIRTASTR